MKLTIPENNEYLAQNTIYLEIDGPNSREVTAELLRLNIVGRLLYGDPYRSQGLYNPDDLPTILEVLKRYGFAEKK